MIKGLILDTKTLQQLILYIVDQVQDLGGYTTTIRLVKFLYLIDLENYRRYGRTLTGLDWKFHLYGPYAFELPRISQQIGFDLQTEEFKGNGKTGFLLKSSITQRFPSTLPSTSQIFIEGILNVWGDRDTSELLDYVYYRTEPMLEANRGETLDFSKVGKGTRYYELYIPIEDSKVNQLRKFVSENSQKEDSEYVTPQTWIDEALLKGLDSLQDG